MRMSLVVFSGWRFLSTNSILSLTGLILENDNKEIWEIRRASIYYKFTIEDILRKIECLGYRASRASGRPSVSMLTHPPVYQQRLFFTVFLRWLKCRICTFLCDCRIVVLWTTVSLLHGPFSVLPFCRLHCITKNQEEKRWCTPYTE